jgi:uncharacterized protein
MEMSREYRVAAPRARVWAALNDPEILKQCVTGCEAVEKLSDTEFIARVNARVGPVNARFVGKVTLSELDPPNGYRISGEGQGGVAGFAKGAASVKLSDDGDGTKLSYMVEAQVGGKLAQLGSRLIDGVARKYADDFFAKFVGLVGGAQPAPVPAAATPLSGPSTLLPVSQPGPSEIGRLPPWLWVAILAALVAAVLYFFTR